MGHTESGATWIGFASSVCHDKGCVSDCHVPDVDHTGHRKTEGLSGRERGNEEGGGVLLHFVLFCYLKIK